MRREERGGHRETERQAGMGGGQWDPENSREHTERTGPGGPVLSVKSGMQGK